MIIKNIIGIAGLFIYLISIIRPYTFYCNHIMGMADIVQILLSICFIDSVLHSMLIIGLLYMIKFSKNNLIIFQIILIIILGIIVKYINIGGFTVDIGSQLGLIMQMLKFHIGSFLGIFLGILFFKNIQNSFMGLIILIILWVVINIIYPMIA